MRKNGQMDGVKITDTDVTEVLYVCSDCGEPKTRELVGNWKLEDVKRLIAGGDPELVALKKMAGLSDGQQRH